ncbi:hypothetical protein [Coleofasciculus sp. E2-BRE-01]|uniref:hypothetical protein n=1 Tax=Coleofasciculus sp. E2-BRE-01 TaxID=3069524 RepID=UPI0040648243
MDEVIVGAVVYLVLTWVFTTKFIESKFDNTHKRIKEVKKIADDRGDENEAYIRRLEVILQVYLQGSGFPQPYDSIQTEVKKNPELD